MVMMHPSLAPTQYIDATPLAAERARAIPIVVEPSARRLAVVAPEPVPVVVDVPATVEAPARAV